MKYIKTTYETIYKIDIKISKNILKYKKIYFIYKYIKYIQNYI